MNAFSWVTDCPRRHIRVVLWLCFIHLQLFWLLTNQLLRCQGNGEPWPHIFSLWPSAYPAVSEVLHLTYSCWLRHSINCGTLWAVSCLVSCSECQRKRQHSLRSRMLIFSQVLSIFFQTKTTHLHRNVTSPIYRINLPVSLQNP